MKQQNPLPSHVDCLIIGGGINGTAIAADAAGRGLSVLLCDKNDLGSGTSNWSTKLIHGGLRYLEQYNFKQVRGALIERDILLQRAPFIVKPMAFILPHEPHLRPRWMIRAGLFLYDHLARSRYIPTSRGIRLDHKDPTQPLRDHCQRGFRYYDCQTDDHRLVILNALSAKQHGAHIRPHTAVERAQGEENVWEVDIRGQDNKIHTVYARALINASGPWMNENLDQRIQSTSTDRVTLIQGSHIVVNKLYPQPHAYLLQIADGRIIFTIPFHHQFTLIGTTDTPFQGQPENAHITTEEEAYLLEHTNRYFKNNITVNDIVWRYSGLRALYSSDKENPANITREYTLTLNTTNHPPLLNVLGGKLTTHRRLAEDAMERLRPFFSHMGESWTANHPLPGGDITGNLHHFETTCQETYPWLSTPLIQYYINQYGSRIHLLLTGCSSMQDLGQHFAGTCYAQEIDYLREHEWASHGDDILWRRTKHGLSMSHDEKTIVKNYCKQKNHEA